MVSPPDPDQLLASDPSVSAFVMANAGSGKTHTLVNRVARLLLAGASPETILCLTYTKAAASEMQRRLFGQLGGWSVMADSALRVELAKLEREDPNAFDKAFVSRARKLFAQALETPGGLKIQTIHAFCERLLRRFPVEAGVPPGFEVADETMASTLATEAREAVALRAMSGEADLAEAYARFSVALAFPDFQRMFQTFEERREAIRRWNDRCPDLDAAIAQACGIAQIGDAGAIEAEAVLPPSLNLEGWRQACADLGAGSTSDQQVADLARSLVDAASQGRSRIELARQIFLRKTDGGRRTRLATQKVAAATSTFLSAEQDRLVAVLETAQAHRVARDTVFAVRLARAYGDEYERAKRRRGVLDFADLVARTAQLLATGDQAAWVLYKLDGGVDHILVDEAQDTSPDQWEIIRSLAQEFFAGEGSVQRKLPPTVFVVGDEKQSIYSFQGARPERLELEQAHYSDLVRGAQRAFERVSLLKSWRSVPQVLRYVDVAFSPAPLTQAIQPRPATPRDLVANDDALLISHIAERAGDQGCIDLWPIEEEVRAEPPSAWDEAPGPEARGAFQTLAGRIADEIVRLVERGEQVHDRESKAPRPADYGDVLILVRRRGVLFKELIRALKRKGAPVAGADRLALGETSVFDDLLALGRFVLFPDDDLTLAGVLRSPLCDISEDDLYGLARGRGSRSLWSILQARRSENPAWTESAARLEQALVAARRRTPFEFFSRFAFTLDGEGRSMKTRLRTRLGPEAEDALDEFLAQVLALEQSGLRDLEAVCRALADLTVTVKREMDEPKGEVRVMTTHGAKGLEAPIVFLPETVLAPVTRLPGLLETESQGFLWSAKKADDCVASAAARERARRKDEEEVCRLLYVALTRARDRVVIAGRLPPRRGEPSIKGWWRIVNDAFADPRIAAQVRTIDQGGFVFRRYGHDPRLADARASPAGDPYPLPDWAKRPAPADRAQVYASPSQVLEDATGRHSANSPLARTEGGLGRFRRGDIIHRLLQILPDVAPERRGEAARRLLAKEGGLTEAQRTEMAGAALRVLTDPVFAAVFGPGSRAEVALAGASPRLPQGLNVSGRMDRVVVEPDRVLVIDYKTNRPAPDRIEDCDPAYVTQMAVYAAVLAEVFPGRRIEAALVWTDGPKLMAVPENMMADALAALNRDG